MTALVVPQLREAGAALPAERAPMQAITHAHEPESQGAVLLR